MSKTLLDTSRTSRVPKSRPDSVSIAPIASDYLLTCVKLVSVWAAVDQGLSDRIAKAVGAPTVQPLKAKSAAEALKFRHNIGLACNFNKL